MNYKLVSRKSGSTVMGLGYFDEEPSVEEAFNAIGWAYCEEDEDDYYVDVDNSF